MHITERNEKLFNRIANIIKIILAIVFCVIIWDVFLTLLFSVSAEPEASKWLNLIISHRIKELFI